MGSKVHWYYNSEAASTGFEHWYEKRTCNEDGFYSIGIESTYTTSRGIKALVQQAHRQRIGLKALK